MRYLCMCSLWSLCGFLHLACDILRVKEKKLSIWIMRNTTEAMERDMIIPSPKTENKEQKIQVISLDMLGCTDTVLPLC